MPLMAASNAAPIFSLAVIVWMGTTFPNYKAEGPEKLQTSYLGQAGQAIEPILIPMNKDMECLFENLLEEVLKHRSEETEKEINRLAFKLYDLSPAEINYITDFVTQSQQSQ